MTRTCIAALLALGGLASPAPAQVYTTYYSPGYTTYYHAPAYSSYSYTTGYGPLGLINWRSWASPYTTAYSPSYTYTAAYSPVVTTPVTSYYAPTADATIAYYSTPVVASANPCCNPCCTPCTACAACPSGTCPGGDCSLNYGPVDMKPTPDPNSSGTRTYSNESNGAGGAGTNGGEEDGFRRTRPETEGDATSRGAGYGPQRPIEQRAPTDGPADEPEAAGESEEGLNAPGGDDPAADASLLDLDTRVTQAPSLLRERLPMRARFGSPKLARAKVDPAALPAASDVRLVRK